jgi:hypothetical protein
VTSRELRRRRRHQPIGWRAVVEFNAESGKRSFDADIRDVSTIGAAFLSDERSLTGKVVKLLVSRSGEAKPLRITARVVSSARTPAMTQTRYGLAFVRLPHDGLDELERILRSLEEGAHEGKAAATAASADAGAEHRRGRLADLRKLAEAKRAEAKPPDRRDELDASLSEALRIAYRYLKDLAEQLNVIKPVYPKAYAIPGLAEFPRLAWEEGKADFQMREVTPILKRYDRVSLRFRLAGPKQIKFARDYPASEKLKQFLDESGLAYVSHDMYNVHGAVEGSKFLVTCEVRPTLMLFNELALGKVLLRASNVSGFGALSQLISPDAIDDQSLDELTAFILGEAKGPGRQLLRNA